MIKTIIFALSIIFIAIPAAVSAQPLPMQRCSEDRLDAASAIQRIAWARRCALITNTAGPNSWFGSPKEYREINPNRSYSSSSNDYNINFNYASCRYNATPIFTEVQDTSGATAGFWNWVGSVQRPRPIYPTFETTPTIGGGIPLTPLPSLPNDCKLYQRSATGVFSVWSGNFYVVAFCVPS